MWNQREGPNGHAHRGMRSILSLQRSTLRWRRKSYERLPAFAGKASVSGENKEGVLMERARLLWVRRPTFLTILYVRKKRCSAIETYSTRPRVSHDANVFT